MDDNQRTPALAHTPTSTTRTSSGLRRARARRFRSALLLVALAAWATAACGTTPQPLAATTVPAADPGTTPPVDAPSADVVDADTALTRLAESGRPLPVARPCVTPDPSSKQAVLTHVMVAADDVPTLLTVSSCLGPDGSPTFRATAFRLTRDHTALVATGADCQVPLASAPGTIRVAIEPGDGYTMLQQTNPDGSTVNALLHVTALGVTAG